MVRTEGIITSLVFDHALRIRLKAETANKDASTAGADDASLRSASSTKGTNSPEPDTDDADEDGDSTTVHSRSTTAATSASTSTAATAVASPVSPAKGKDADKDKDKKEEKKEEKELPKAKGSNLIGKINNLVTSDLEQITEGRDFLFLSE